MMARLAGWTGPTPGIGDLNCDNLLDFRDINPFVLALTAPDAYVLAYPDCSLNNADINGDGAVGLGDINPFVNLLAGAAVARPLLIIVR
jgi:hypothetical protein